MPGIKPEMLDAIKKKFGSKIDISSNNDVLKDLLAEVLQDHPEMAVASYDRTYDRGYEKNGYDRNYQQYDKTTDPE